MTPVQKRPDRMLCRLATWAATGMEMIGQAVVRVVALALVVCDSWNDSWRVLVATPGAL
jgi:hypothetical protein